MATRLRIILIALFMSNFMYGQELSIKTNSVHVNFTEADISKPVITWISPDVDSTGLQIKRGFIKVGVNSKIKLKNVTLYINNLPTSNDRGFSEVSKEDSKFDEIFEKEITLNEGDNFIKIVAEDVRGEVTIETRIINVDIPSLLTRNDYALLIATDEYDSWNDLVNPINDASAIAKELEESYGFKVELAKNPTKAELLGLLRNYAKKSYLEHDQLFIFIAGHGQFDEFFAQGYLVCKDSKRQDEVKSTYLPHALLRDVVNNIPVNHVLLSIDACFGGTLDPLIARAGHRGADDVYNELSHSEYIQRKLRFKTRKYLTSGGKEYVPDGRPGRHSPFASKILETLRNYGGKDKIVTLAELMGFVEKINPEPRTGSFGDDEPGSDFVFVVK